METTKQDLKEQIIDNYRAYCDFADDFPIESAKILKGIKKNLEKYLHYYVPSGLKSGKTGMELVSALSETFIGTDIQTLINKNTHVIHEIIGEDLPKYENTEKTKASAEKIRKFFQLCPQFASDFLVSSVYYNKNHHILDSIFFSVHKEHLPSTYRGLIVVLGGDPNKSTKTGYVLALLRGKTQGEQYLKRQREKVATKQDIISFFQNNREYCKYLGCHSYADNYNMINKAFRDYYQKSHNIGRVFKVLPKTSDGLSSLLGGPKRKPRISDIMDIIDGKI